jgi:Transposase zinc-binding domain
MLEVADIFRAHGSAWRRTVALSLGQLKVMSAIEQCRSAALGGHVLRCSGCARTEIAVYFVAWAGGDARDSRPFIGRPLRRFSVRALQEDGDSFLDRRIAHSPRFIAALVARMQSDRLGAGTIRRKMYDGLDGAVVDLGLAESRILLEVAGGAARRFRP